MSGIMGTIHEGYALGEERSGSGSGSGVNGVGDIADDYVGDFATTFDPTPSGPDYSAYTGDTPTSVTNAIADQTIYNNAQVQDAFLASPNQATRTAAINALVASGQLETAPNTASMPSSWFTPANVGKAVLVGNALYHIASTSAGIQAVPVPTSIFGSISPMMLALLAGVAFLALS